MSKLPETEVLQECNAATSTPLLCSADWRQDIIPGCYYIRFNSNAEAVVYGQIIAKSGQPGFWLTQSYSRDKASDGLGKTHSSAMTMLLSREQFDAARKGVWPCHPSGIQNILTLPSN